VCRSPYLYDFLLVGQHNQHCAQLLLQSGKLDLHSGNSTSKQHPACHIVWENTMAGGETQVATETAGRWPGQARSQGACSSQISLLLGGTANRLWPSAAPLLYVAPGCVVPHKPQLPTSPAVLPAAAAGCPSAAAAAAGHATPAVSPTCNIHQTHKHTQNHTKTHKWFLVLLETNNSRAAVAKIYNHHAS
jgi:hypothetical protein